MVLLSTDAGVSLLMPAKKQGMEAISSYARAESVSVNSD